MPYSAMQLAEAFLKTGELDDARDAINQQLDAHPEDDEARRLLIQLQMRMLSVDKLDNLLKEFDKLKESTAEDWHHKSIIFERIDNLDEALAAIQSAQDLNPEDERLTERHLDLLLAREKYDEALALVRQQAQTWRWLEREGDVLVLLGDDMLATARYGLVLSQLAEFDNVMRDDYLQALKVRVILARAHAYRRMGHIDTARNLYQVAQTMIGEDVTIQFNLGLIEAMEGNQEAARILCAEALTKASHHLQQTMLDSLQSDAQFAALKQALNR